MRATVYGVEAGGGWRWCLSVALEADALWWRQQGVERIWIWGERFSLGQAAERYAALCARRQAGPVPQRGEWVDLRAWRGGFVREERLYERLMALLAGRLLHREEIESLLKDQGLDRLQENWLPYVQWGVLEGRLRLRHGVEPEAVRGWRKLRRRGRWDAYRCVRCGSSGKLLRPVPCPVCSTECPYCEACLGMGRVRYCSLVVQGLSRETSRVPLPVDDGFAARWGLSPAQAEAAGEALRYMAREPGGMFLFWAVTGAGKTEMIFPLIERALAGGGRALVATPRRDVVLELAPRLKAAFPDAAVVTLYGGSAERWDPGEVTVATTHQLFRFREAFDLVVLDEVDAFPFHGDAQLAFAAEAACKRTGTFVLLSATPPEHLRRAAERGKLAHAKVCVRFHRHPLPVPVRLAAPPMRRWRVLPPRVRRAMESSLRRGAQLFVFVPYISAVEPLVRLLQAAFPGVPIDGTSSKDAERGDKVLRFRSADLRIIVTTTILERGVTVPKTDVFILDADNRLFDSAALVQMAGRAGRKLEDPRGHVYFCSSDWTRAQRRAVRDIRTMNALARKKGYLAE